MRYKFSFILLFLLTLFLHLNSDYDRGRDLSDDICELDGYTMIDCTTAEGEVEGESGEIIKLYNGMIFELNDYNYNYSYSPEVGIFAKKIKFGEKDVIVYKLAIENELYDATRIR